MVRDRSDVGVRRPQPESSAVRVWIARGILLAVLAAIVSVMVFWVVPSIRRKRIAARFETAENYRRNGNAEAALEEYARIEKDYSGSEAGRRAAQVRAELEPYVKEARTKITEANSAFKKQDYEKAWRLYCEIAERFPESRHGASAKRSLRGTAKLACDDFFRKAQEAQEAHRWDAAKHFYGKVVEINPEYAGGSDGLKRATENVANFEKYMTQGKRRVAGRKWPAARDFFDKALAILPENKDAYEARARVLQKIPFPKGMTLIAPGEFVVGSDDGDEDERPPRKKKQDGFYLDVKEVTNKDYARFVADAGHPPPPHWGGREPPKEISKLPVVCVSWHSAAAYAKWAGKRLPTEVEWERAARGRNGRNYPWGGSFACKNAVYARRAEPTGSRPEDRSVEGCLDMAGNVSEWTSARVDGRCVIRGNSWAGFERERSDRVVADDIAAIESDPVKTVVIDHPSAWGLTVRGFSEIKFFFRGYGAGVPSIEIRKYIPALDEYLVRNFAVRKGEPIAGRHLFKVSIAGRRQRLAVDLDTGCKLVDILNPGNPAKVEIMYEDPWGKRHRLKRVRPRKERPPLGESDPSRARLFKAVVETISSRPLARTARSANRMTAPPEAGFINCGFRCAGDLVPRRRPE